MVSPPKSVACSEFKSQDLQNMGVCHIGIVFHRGCLDNFMPSRTC